MPPVTDSETAFLRRYDPADYPNPAVTVDCALLTVRDDQLHILLIERGAHPHRGAFALPGGFVEPDENLDTAAARELAEETGLDTLPSGIHLEQLRTYGNPDRDPRMRVITVAYIALAPGLPDPTAGGDAAAAAFHPIGTLRLGLEADEPSTPPPPLAFDHDQIIRDAVERARAKLEYTTLATRFCQTPFTVGDLRRVYEAVWGCKLHPDNFRRKVIDQTDGFLIPTGQTRSSTSPKGGRPAPLYQPGPATMMLPPLVRPDPGADLRPTR